MSSTPSAKIQCTIHSVGTVSHCRDINRSCAFSLFTSLCVLWCRQLEQTKLLSERERGSPLTSPSLTLPPSNITSPALLLCCYWSLFQLDKCTLLQLQAHHSEEEKKTTKKKTTTWPAHPHRTGPPTLHPAGVGLWLAPLCPPWPLAPLPPPAAPLHPFCHNGLSLSWQYKWTRVSAYSAAFQKEKERKTSA